MLSPKKIERVGDLMLKITWRDGFESTFKLKDLRYECPCAKCSEDKETKEASPFPVMPIFKQGMNDIVSLTMVGNYALKAVWGDGHDFGLYSWDTLRYISEKYDLSEKEIEKLFQKK